MKYSRLAICMVLFFAPTRADTVTAADAVQHVGQTVTEMDTVTGVHTARPGTTFINMGATIRTTPSPA